MNNELKPCPFCGGSPKLSDWYDRGDTCHSWLAVIVHGCTENCEKYLGASVRFQAGGKTMDEAIKNVINAWNKRAENEQLH